MMEYIRPSQNQTEELKRLYKTCFAEKKSVVDLLFEQRLSADICYAAQCGGRITAALYLMPAHLSDNGGLTKAHYLFAAGTLPRYRGKGIMRCLIGYALEDAKKNGDKYSVLLPANKGLYGYYAGLGYKASFKAKCMDLTHGRALMLSSDRSVVTNCSFDNITDLRFNILLGHNGSLQWNKEHVALAAQITKEYGGDVFCADIGAVFYLKEGNRVSVHETVCREQDFKTLIATFAEHVKAKSYLLRTPAFTGMTGRTINFGMSKPLGGKDFLFEDVSAAPYLGLALD